MKKMVHGKLVMQNRIKLHINGVVRIGLTTTGRDIPTV